MALDKDSTVELIGQLSCACSPSGFEDETCYLVHVFVEHELDGAVSRETNLRNVLITPAGVSDPADAPERCRVMLDAHGDEVGLMVKSIRPNGTMTFVQLGHYTENALPGEHFWVRNTEGDWLDAVVVAKSPHFQSQAEREGRAAPELLLDCGATSEADARDNFHMGVGEPAVPATEFAFDPERGVMFGKAFDDRAGVAAVLLTLRELERRAQETGERPQVDYVGCISSQEEVGARGTGPCARWARPACAIMFEGAPADDTFAPEPDVQTALKGGPMLRYMDVSMITNPRFQRLALSVAERHGIKHQVAVRQGGGTNGGPVHLMDEGIPCIVIAIPCRYVHAGTCIMALEDLEGAVDLAVAIVEELTPEAIAEF